MWLARPPVHDDCACSELLNPSHQRLVGELSPVVCLQERWRAVLEEDIHQVSLPGLPNGVWDGWLKYHLVRVLLTGLAEI